MLVFEVVSNDQGGFDHTTKFALSRSIDSVKESVLVDEHSRRIDVYFRHTSGLWDIQTFDTLDQQVQLQSLKISISMPEIYLDVVFGEIDTRAGVHSDG